MKMYLLHLMMMFTMVGLAQVKTTLLSPEQLPAIMQPALPTTSLPPGNDILKVSIKQGKQLINKNIVPQFSNNNKTVQPGESLLLIGVNFNLPGDNKDGSDSKFAIGYFNSKGVLTVKPLTCSYLENNMAIVVISDSLPFGIYIIWASNKNGWGAPLVVNNPDLWWVGPEDAVTEDSVCLYGRNLSKKVGESNLTWLYLKPANSSKPAFWLKAVSSNNYRALFFLHQIPEGEYSAWIQNGRSDRLGFSEPAKLRIRKAIHWGTKKFNVKDAIFGAKGDGKTDDEAAIQKCLDEAAKVPFSTVYLPAGVYKVSRGFNPPSNIEWLGDGKEKTQILLSNNFIYNPALARQYTLLFSNENTVQCSNARFRGLSFKVQQGASGNMKSVVYMRGSLNIHFDNCLIEASPGFERLDMSNSKNVYFDGGELILNGAFFSNARQFFFRNMVYTGILDANVMLEFWGCNGVNVTNCQARARDNSNKGQTSGRFLYGSNIWGSNINIYSANNTTVNLAPRKSAEVDQNSGEQFLWEGTNIAYTGKGKSTDDGVLVLTGFSASGNALLSTGNLGVFIISGRGAGQYRNITKAETSSITLSKPWAVSPDNSSVFMISSFSGNCVLYKNNIDGKAERINDAIASSGIQLYGNCINFICDGNNIKDVVTGISTWAQIGGYQRNSNIQSFCYFNEFRNNTCENVRTGLGIFAFNWYNEHNPQYQLYLGNAFIKNTFKKCNSSAIDMSARQMTGANIEVSLFDKNSFQFNARNLKVNDSPKNVSRSIKNSLETFNKIQIMGNQEW